MQSIEFPALGTQFVILVDEEKSLVELKKKIRTLATDFENRFTRFRDDSEVGRINLAGEGEYKVSAELTELLRFGLTLRDRSRGAFDPQVGAILTAYGYAKGYRFQPEAKIKSTLGCISLAGRRLTIKGGAQIDLGGWGKGYLIDRIREILEDAGRKFFLVDGGGDFYGTTKADGSPWTLGLEHPLKHDEIIGLVNLAHSALAGSGVGKRKVGAFHHLIDMESKKPKSGVLSCHVQAKAAVVVDGLATALMLVSERQRLKLAADYRVEYALVKSDYTLEKSPGFSGEFFFV